MKYFSRNKFAVALVFSFLASCAAFATPTQGSLGASSTGIANISITKTVQAQITDVKDMTLSNWTLSDGAVTLTSDLCVYSSTGSYTVTASGNGLANIFTLASGSNLLAYSVNWNGGGAGSLSNTGTLLLPTIPSLPFSNANTSNATCSGGGSSNDTARVIVSVTALAMTAAAGSSTPYTGTLTMLISPF